MQASRTTNVPVSYEAVRSYRQYVDTTIPIDPEYKDYTFRHPSYTSAFEWYTPNSSGSRRNWKSFEHYKRSLVIPESNMGCSNGIGSLSNSKRYRCVIKSPLFGFDGLGDLFGPFGQWDQNPQLEGLFVNAGDNSYIPSPSDLETLKQNSLRVMLPHIKAELSLINSLIELKDFRSIGRTLTNIRSVLPSLKRNAKAGSSTLRRLLRASADSYLQMQFNILPLLSDISALRSALSRTERRMNDLITRQGRTRDMHYAYRWAEHEPSRYDAQLSGSFFDFWYDPGTGYVKNGAHRVKQERFVYTDSAIFHAQIQYNYNYTGYQAEHARLLALLDALGVNLNPAIIWNAIPWSFVVDWVFGVNRWLDQFKKGNMDPVINIHRYLWSVLRKRRILLHKNVIDSAPFPNQWPGMIPAPVVHETSYKRVVGIPDRSSIVSGGLSLKEFSLGAALVVSRRRRQSKRS